MLESVQQYFRHLNETRGVNLVYLYRQHEFEAVLGAISTSLQLMLSCMAFACVIGLAGVVVLQSNARFAKGMVRVYVDVVRNTPPYLQLLFFFFIVAAVFPAYDAGGYEQPFIPAFGWAVIALGIYGGAFTVEVLRSGVEAVPHATVEAAEALGYGKYLRFFRIVLPIGYRIALPAFNSNLISVAKSSSLAYAIGVPEMMYTANQIWSDDLNVPEMMLTAFLFYLLSIGSLTLVLGAVERRIALPV